MIGEFNSYVSKQTGNEYPLKCYHAKFINGFYVPCGKCEFCMQTKAREWAFRLEQEALFKHCYNCLLTYDDYHLPYYKGAPSLNKVHIQLFMKRFRYYCEKYFNTKITFFLCGEYGGNYHRPHYHLIVFSDLPLHERCADPYKKVTKFFSDAWNYGLCDIEPLNDVGGSVGYLVKYMTSYSDGREYDKHNKPFLLMSRTGLGKTWIRTHPNQVKKMIQDKDYTISVNGFKQPLPRYLRRKIMPEEQQIANADMYYDYCQEKRFNYTFLTKQNKRNYETKRKQDRSYQHQRERDNYRKAKIHANNSNTSQLSRRANAAEE